jgi:hypothetical protein
MDESVLLLNTIPVRDMNLSHPAFDYGHGGLYQMHGVLLVEARQYAFSKVRVGYMGHG